MLAEVALARTFGMDLEALTTMAVGTGKEQVTRFDLSALMVDDEDDSDDFSDGI